MCDLVISIIVSHLFICFLYVHLCLSTSNNVHYLIDYNNNVLKVLCVGFNPIQLIYADILLINKNDIITIAHIYKKILSWKSKLEKTNKFSFSYFFCTMYYNTICIPRHMNHQLNRSSITKTINYGQNHHAP